MPERRSRLFPGEKSENSPRVLAVVEVVVWAQEWVFLRAIWRDFTPGFFSLSTWRERERERVRVSSE